MRDVNDMAERTQAPDTGPALDFHALLEAGIEHLAELAPDQWTDFNAHDPGITILDQVCWAITDLGYRLDHPVEDILAELGGPPGSGIVSPASALGSAPVTMDDLRRCLLDIPGVDNAWIEPDADARKLYYNHVRGSLGTEAREAETDELDIAGLWRVSVAGREPEDTGAGSLREQVVRRLFAERPLCQDFAAIDVLTPESIRVDADIEIGPVADAETLMVTILAEIDRQISPRPRFGPVREALAAGRSLADLYEGPVLDHGVIDPTTMPGTERPAELHASDILRAIMDIDGVRAVRRLRLAIDGVNRPDGTPDWQTSKISVSPNRAPRLDARPGDIRLRRDQLPLRTDFVRVQARLRAAREAERRAVGAVAATAGPPLPSGRRRNIARYQSILHQFPEAYGVGPEGLAAGSSPLRQARMLQLKAYLQIYDQLLANCFAQAANAAALLSGTDVDARLYRAGEIEEQGLDLDAVRRDPGDYQAAIRGRADAESAAPLGVALRRRQLDHLLARFGETFVDPTPLGAAEVGSQTDAEAWDGLHDRAAFLGRIAPIGAGRGTAANDLLPAAPGNRSGLEERIALLLCLDEAAGERFLMVEHVLLRMLAEDHVQTVPLLRDLASPDPFSLQVSFVFPAGRGRFADGDQGQGFREFAEHVIRDATPAHLTPYVHWLDNAAFREAEAAVERWRETRRKALARRFALAEGAS
jgi:hypothetical protein